MRLTDLEPTWLMFEGRRVGFIFKSPIDPRWWQTCFVEKFYLFKGRDCTYSSDDVGYEPDSQTGIVEAAVPAARDWFQPCNPEHQWTTEPAIAQATFDNISVKPSLDGSGGGLWHGHITNGQIVGGV